MSLPFKPSKMVLKRKRSASELSASSGSSFASPPALAGIASPFVRTEAAPAYLNSRTMKRFRDSRPSEAEVHQRTLNLLYSAQHHPETTPAPEPQHQEPSTPAAPARNQQSLHRFWIINSAPTAAPTTQTGPAITESPACCDDCGSGNEDAMDVDGSESAAPCGACGRHVCFGCSVGNLGEERRCLRCAGRRVAGGGGWESASLPVC